MRDSYAWWNTTKNDPNKLYHWLEKQYHGERMAHLRINQFLKQHGRKAPIKVLHAIQAIAVQEATHARWIGSLLEMRGGHPQLLMKEERYWDRTLPQIDNFTTGCAVAAHAEKMRLDRIRVIAEDDTGPRDIQGVFQKILPQEIWHEKVFREAAGELAMRATETGHEAGARALGLVA